MRYLTCSLLAEGDSDLAFLGRLLHRQLEELASSSGGFFFEQIVSSPCRTIHGKERVLASIAGDLNCYDLVLAHNDHNESAKLDQVREKLCVPPDSRLIGLVPVRETEAWMLADPDALRSLGGGVDVSGLSAKPGDVERIKDPKAVLKRVLGRRVR